MFLVAGRAQTLSWWESSGSHVFKAYTVSQSIIVTSPFSQLSAYTELLSRILSFGSSLGILAERSQSGLDLRRLVSPSESNYLPPIEYAYDPLASIITLPPQTFWYFPNFATRKNPCTVLNSIQLDPHAAGLPYRSSIRSTYANKHWTSNRTETLRLLKLLASDDSESDIVVDQGITLAKLAKKQLRPGVQHNIALATQYMYPSADPERIKLISALMLLYFVFDDKAEETPDGTLDIFRDDFIRRLEGRQDSNATLSSLQSHIKSIVESIKLEDTRGGNGGREMLQALRNAFQCVHTDEGGFKSVNDYLHFRRSNVGAEFVIAAAKFSIKSDVSVSDARFSHYLSLVGDHLGLFNDLASYDKELRALLRGDTKDMINIVDVIKRLTWLEGTAEAKSVVWALQLQFEKQMMEELERLRRNSLTDEEWWFLEAVTSTVTGNVMYCMTTGRYGGEAARIRITGSRVS
ncbi:MAG: hypothetical protein Q9195_007778 [Heterodermia aff. obscurata]